MPYTLIGLAIAIAFVLPGFITADLAESRRASKASRSDLELVLRGLVWALLIQSAVAATGWTQTIVDDVSSGNAWEHHLGELVTFSLVVGIVVPTVLGSLLSVWLRRSEQRRQLRFWHYALGARDYRKAWDYLFGRQDGAYLLLTVTEDGGAKHFLGKYGEESYATQAPTHPEEIYLERAWPADADGIVEQVVLEREPQRGMWVNSDKIERLEIIDPPQGQSGGE
ncbi:MAG TPA: DUF6338 family protein [Solirubrobacterales bacterium]|nr:DUF6338 family protein [Solirubrobacterales bacterium]